MPDEKPEISFWLGRSRNGKCRDVTCHLQPTVYEPADHLSGRHFTVLDAMVRQFANSLADVYQHACGIDQNEKLFEVLLGCMLLLDDLTRPLCNVRPKVF